MGNNSCTKEEFDIIYDKYNQLVYRISMLHVGNEEDAKDIMQEVFVKRIYSAPAFNDEEHEKRWLIRVAVNLCHDCRKSFWKRNKVPLEDYMQKTSQIAYVNDSQFTGVVGEAIYSMPDKYKDVIHLHYYEGYSVSETAAILGISESATKMRLKRGRLHLKMELE